jgi:hypothetical protein
MRESCSRNGGARKSIICERTDFLLESRMKGDRTSVSRREKTVQSRMRRLTMPQGPER